MKKRLYLIAAAALALVACAKEEAYQPTESTIPGAKRIVLGASFELPGDPTKSDYDAAGNFTWSDDDAIWIGSNETNGDNKWGSGPIIKGQSEIGPGHATAQFDCTIMGDVTAIAAVFPKTVKPSYSAGALSLTLPATIAWTDTQLANPANATMQVDNIMVARYVDIYSGGYAHGTTENIQFRNVGGLFCLTLKNVPAGADKLVFTADKKINGTFAVSNVDDSKDGNNYPVIATAATETKSEKSVTITFPTITNGENKMTFFIPVPVGSYVIGFDVQNAEAASLWAFSASRENGVERGHIVKMPTLSHVIVGGSGDGATNIITTPTGFSGTVNLPSTNNSIYVRMNQTGGTITLAYADAPALHPANVYLQALGNVETLDINLPDSHVELTGEDDVQHVITNVSSYTSYSTLKVDNKVKIGKDEDEDSGITITGGSLDLAAPVNGKVTVNIPAANNNETEEKVAINITSAIKDLVVTRAADNVTPADKVYVSLGNGASVAKTISVPEVNCNLYVAPGVAVSVIETKAAENTVEGNVETLSATGASTIVTVTQNATVTEAISASDNATIIVDNKAIETLDEDDKTETGGGTITGVTTGSVALAGGTGYTTLAAAIDAVEENGIVTVIKADATAEKYALPNTIGKTLTITASVDGAVIDMTNATAAIASGKTATFKNLTFNLGNSFYHGFGTKDSSEYGVLVMDGCTIEGSLTVFGVSTFNNCKFTATDANAGYYNIWAVLSNATFTGCSFSNTNRAVNVYDFKHSSDVKTVSFSNCSFTGTAAKKAAINIHHNPDGTAAKYAVTITDCTTSGTWASSVEETGEPADATICNSALWMVSDILNWTNGDITVNGVNVYEVSVAQIGDVKYATVEEAFAAVPDNTPTTITMIANASLGSEQITIASNKVITLELNGKTVSKNAAKSASDALFCNRGTLTIQDNTDTQKDGTGTGKVSYQSGTPDSKDWPGYASNTISNNGILTIKSGYVENITEGGYAAYTVDNVTNGTLYTPVFNMEGGKLYNKGTDAVRMFLNSTSNLNQVNVSGGIIDGSKDGRIVCIQDSNSYASKGEFNMTGGVVTKDVSGWSAANNEYTYTDAQYEQVRINISGGQMRAFLTTYMPKTAARAEALRVTGGTFEVDPSDYVSAGYRAVQSGDKWNVEKLPGVAQIGDSYYATLTDAIEAAQAGDEITILADQTITRGYVIDKSLTINLNGKTVSFEGVVGNGRTYVAEGFTQSRAFKITGSADFTLKNGTVALNEALLGSVRFSSTGNLLLENYTTNNSRGWGLNIKLENGTAVLKNVTINSVVGGGVEVNGPATATMTDCVINQTGKDSEPWISAAVSVAYGGHLTVNSGSYSALYASYIYTSGGTLDILGGTFTGRVDGSLGAAVMIQKDNASYPEPKAIVNINNGTFNGKLEADNPNCALNISGGTFNKGDFSQLIDIKPVASASITGGTFDSDPSAYVAAGYEAVKSDDNWNVQPKSALTVGDGGTYESLAAAINAAESGSIVKLVSDVNVTSTIYFRTNDIEEKDFTLDLNGHKIASTATLFYIGNDSNITINDSGSNGTIDVAADEAIYVSSGKVTLESGALSVHGTSSYTYGVQVGSSGTFVMDGGSITIPSSSTSTYNYCVSTSSGVITINGGDLVAQASGGNYAVSTSGGVATVNGGTIIAYACPAGFKSPYVFYGSGSKTITGGYFKAIGDKNTYSAGYLVAEEATATISGGYFGGNYHYGIPAEKVADGYKIITLDGSQTDEADAAAYSDGYKFAVKAKQS